MTAPQRPASNSDARKRAEERTAENDAACPTPCDDDCAVACHEWHAVAWKRHHQPHDCPTRVIPTGSDES